MSKEILIIILGIIVTFTPFLGIPIEWKTYVLGIIGILLIIFGYLLRRAEYLRSIDHGGGERGTDSFKESTVENTIRLSQDTKQDGAI